MKLKTLKDIERCPDCECLDEKCVIPFSLKKEAIKQVKYLNGALEREELKELDLISWIKHFFNITEEDLK